jgi:tryptophan synthase alpha chain
MDRIADQFARARSENRACFVAYVCAGDPDYATSLRVCRTLVEGGVDILELGVPFSDPLADGLTNQLAAQRALESGMTADRVFDLVREVRKFTQIPIVFYTYYNLVFTNGVAKYVERAREAGVDGMLTLDLPPEEAEEVLEVSRRQGMKNIFIIAPTTPPQRMSRIAEAASGFIYYVSREGVTGVREDLAGNIGASVEEIRKHSDLPVVVGFGISRQAQVQEIAQFADGVVVGSALVNCVRDHLGQPDQIQTALQAKLGDLVPGLRRNQASVS